VSTSRVPDAIDAVVSALTAAGVTPVYDGPVITGDQPDVAVYVGYDGDPTGDMAATAGWSQSWAALGAQRKDEQFDVLCCVVAYSGETGVKARRDAVFATLADVEDALRTQVNIGLGLPQPTQAAFETGQLFQEQGPAGLQCRVPFVVSVKTRI